MVEITCTCSLFYMVLHISVCELFHKSIYQLHEKLPAKRNMWVEIKYFTYFTYSTNVVNCTKLTETVEVRDDALESAVMSLMCFTAWVDSCCL